MKDDKLIYGKSNISNIVSIEADDDTLEIFTQDKEGNNTSTFLPNRYWILSNEPLSSGFVKLEGNLHYQYGIQFKERAQFLKVRAVWKNADIYSIYNPKEAAQVKDGITYYKGLEPKDVSLLSFDIETTGLDPNSKDAFIIMISTTFRNPKGVKKHLFCYKDFSTQAELLESFCTFVQDCNPSIILGHNILQFDLNYMQTIADKEDIELKLGRNGSALKFNTYESTFRVDGNRDLSFKNCYIYGREIVDTYFLSQKFDVAKSLDSYGLKAIIKQLGLEDPNREFYDASQIRFNYKDPVELEKIIKYCVNDSDDSIKLWDKMGPVFFHLAPMIPKAFQDIIMSASGSQLNSLMVRSYLQDMHSIPAASPVEKFKGALSFAVPGIYKNCFKIDLAALYPSIILAYSVYDEEKDPRGYLLQLVRTFKTKRLEYKRLAQETGNEHYSHVDGAAKALLNSFYGFLGAPGLSFNSVECAEFITAKGREILEFTIKWASGKPASEFINEEEEVEHG